MTMPQDVAGDPWQMIADLQRQLDERTAERDALQRGLADAVAQQTATAEVLQVINSSPGDLGPVFDAMLDKAMRLCEASFGLLLIPDGALHRATAHRGLPPALAEYFAHPVPMGRGLIGRLVAGEETAQVIDAADDEVYRAGSTTRQALVDLGGARTGIAVALRKDRAYLGAFWLYRQEALAFSDKQIALLQNFAAQAVIAMENARLITETREALEQQTATAEVLQVINSSPGDLAPVFDATLERALRLCGAAFGFLTIYQGNDRHLAVAMRNVPQSVEKLMREPVFFGPETGMGRLARGEDFVHIADAADDDGYRLGNPTRRAFVDLAGERTYLAVPLRKDGVLLGGFGIYRQEVRPFTDKQIALLQNFAAQAVIAMENARLLGDLRERTDDLQQSLEYQTATSDVLKVISRSTFDLQPVLDTLVQTAARLCDAEMGHLAIRQGGAYRYLATSSLNPEWDAIIRDLSFTPGRGSVVARTALEGRIVHVADIAADSEYTLTEAVTVGEIRTVLGVPLLRESEPIGVIALARHRVEPFTERQIKLVTTFADQAVIAIENARLINETREALDQQTATAEVLQVINSSPGDLAPVFDAMLDKATRLSEAAFGILWTYDGERFQAVAFHDVPPAYVEFLREPQLASPVAPLGRVARGEAFAHITDLAAEEYHERAGFLVRQGLSLGGFRTVLAVPMRKDASLLGAITIYRREVQPFSDKQIALLQNFAAQAVIAMENARLITETREALEQQTATAEILRVVSGLQSDVQPVFEAIVESASKLCAAEFSAVARYDGAQLELVAINNISPEEAAAFYSLFPRVPLPSFVMGRAVVERQPISIEDVLSEPGYDVRTRETLAQPWEYRSFLGVPILCEGEPIGVIGCGRREVKPFTAKQIELVKTFADQAVIAIENARLITETQEALEQQTATADVLGVINASPGELAPVFDAVLEKATQVAEASFGILMTYDGDAFQTVALRGAPPAYAEFMRSPIHPGPLNGLGRLLSGERLIHIHDITADEAYTSGDPLRKATAELGGSRTHLIVPLLKDDVLLGALVVYRQEVRPFTDKQIALLQNFAAQAVIAMENARLLDEIRQRQAELRVTFDNMADGVAMFDENLHLAAWNRNFQEILQLPDEFLAQPHDFDEYIRYLTERGEFGDTDAEVQIKRLRARLGDHYSFERTRPDGKVIEIRNNPIPNGGVVVIYSDITERKRSEEEIRAARDAAQAALRDLRAAQSSLIQAQKMAALGQLTAGIAHEIKNPLNFVNNFAGLSIELLDELKEAAAPVVAALDDNKRAEIDETIEMLTGNLDKIAEHGRRADNIVKSMLEHSRGVSGERREVDLNNLIDEALNLAYHGARAQDREFNTGLEHDYAPMLKPIEVVPQEITRVFLNLFANGFYAAHKRAQAMGNGSFQPLLSVTTRELGNAVEVRIRDNGIGIPDDIKDKLFQPFFTTKPTGEGTGLGLSISYDIITQQHGGTIEAESKPGEFTEFTIRLPRAYRQATAD